jgi:hypothetical protein
VHFSGRDLALGDAAGIPGLLGNPLPMTVTVEPAALLEDLLVQVRDAVLELAFYAWVPTGLIREWSGRGGDLIETIVRFDSRLELPEALLAGLRDEGTGVSSPQSASSGTSLPVTLVAEHDADGGLLLSAVHDRAWVADASTALSQCMYLLRSLPDHRRPDATAADLLGLLKTAEVPRTTLRGPQDENAVLDVLRAGEPQADIVCLVAVPGVTPGAYEMFARGYEGPERIVSLRTGQQGMESALHEVLLPARRLVLCGCGPGGPAAYELARQAAERTAAPIAVIMTGIGGPAEIAQALSRALQAVRTRNRP